MQSRIKEKREVAKGTLLVTFDTFAINPFVFKNLKWDPLRDFTPIMQVCRHPQVLLVNPGLGVRTRT